jgi:hypothetical protein
MEWSSLNIFRLLKKAHLLRYPHSQSLQRTSLYASLLKISGALHLDLFDQPARQFVLQLPVNWY